MDRRASHVCYVTGDSGQPDEAGRHRIRRLIVTGNWREDEQAWDLRTQHRRREVEFPQGLTVVVPCRATF